MKRGPVHLDDVTGAAKRAATYGQFALKLLFSPIEAGFISGEDGNTSAEIQQMTGAQITVSGNGAFYPGTSLQEVSIKGPAQELVLAAAIHCLTKILTGAGSVSAGEADVEPGGGRLKIIVPTKVAAAVIGSGGSNIKQLRMQTGLHIHVEKNAIPPSGGELAEQVVSMSGPLEGIQTGLGLLVEQLAMSTSEIWFPAWVAHSNAGTIIPGLVLDFTGKGAKCGGKGKGKTVPPPLWGGAGGGALGAASGSDPATALAALGNGFNAAPLIAAIADRALVEQASSFGTSPAMAMKVLFSPPEVQSTLGPGGRGIAEIQAVTGTRISTSAKNALYPGTQLQELNIQGPSAEAVLSAITLALSKVQEEMGCLSSGDLGVEPGAARLKVVVPLISATSIIGRGGEEIKALRANTGIHVHVDRTSIPPGGGELSEQVVCMSGSLEGVTAALPAVAAHVAARAGESWFGAWATSSNCGLSIPGLVLECVSKGCKGKDLGKGFGKDFGKDYGKDFGKDYGKDFGKGDWGKDYCKGDWGKDWGKDGGGGVWPPQVVMPPVQSWEDRSAIKRQAEKGAMAMKILFSEREGSCIIGQGGSTIAEIQKITGAKMVLSGRGRYFPGTDLQELNIQGQDMNVVLSALLHCLTKILEEAGAVSGGEANVPPGEGRLRIVVPVRAASMVIGKGGQAIKDLQASSGLQVHVDPNLVPANGGGDLAEQVVSMSGPLQGMQVALPSLAEHLTSLVPEPWFAAWAGHSNCGHSYRGLAPMM